MNRTPLHTRPEAIDRYRDIATDLLNSLTNDVEDLAISNEQERDEDAPLFATHEDAELRRRMGTESWTEQTTQLLRDAMYLLAVGDNGATAVAAADPERVTKQAHNQRRRAARERLIEQGLLSDQP